MLNANKVVESIREMLLVREGEVITPALASERAANIAMALSSILEDCGAPQSCSDETKQMRVHADMVFGRIFGGAR